LDGDMFTKFTMLRNHSLYLYFNKRLEKSYLIPSRKATAERD